MNLNLVRFHKIKNLTQDVVHSCGISSKDQVINIGEEKEFVSLISAAMMSLARV